MPGLPLIDERDPQPLQDFIAISAVDSRVFGPGDSTSTQCSQRVHVIFSCSPQFLRRLLGKHDHGVDWRKQLNDGGPVYLIWPKDDPIPHDLVPANLLLEATFAPKLGKEPAGWRKAGWGSGYPPTNLYRIVDGPASDKNSQNKHPAR